MREDPTWPSVRQTSRGDNDPAILSGWGSRGYNWDSTPCSTSLARAVGERRISAAGYGNLTAVDNTFVTPGITIRIASGAGGPSAGRGRRPLCGFYDVAGQVGQVQNNTTYSSNFGEEKDIYNGADVTADYRMPNGGQVSGGSYRPRAERQMLRDRQPRRAAHHVASGATQPRQGSRPGVALVRHRRRSRRSSSSWGRIRCLTASR